MNILNNRNKRTSIFKAVALCLIAAMSFTLVSCDDDMDIQQSYPFTVEVMPVPNKVVKGQTVEIRCELKKEGDFSGTLYTIRYFQFEGEGSLKMDNGITFSQKDAAAPKTTSTAPITIPDKTDAAPAPLVTIPTGPQAVSMPPQQTQPSPQLPKQPQRAPRSGPNGPRCHIRTTFL